MMDSPKTKNVCETFMEPTIFKANYKQNFKGV